MGHLVGLATVVDVVAGVVAAEDGRVIWADAEFTGDLNDMLPHGLLRVRVTLGKVLEHLLQVRELDCGASVDLGDGVEARLLAAAAQVSQR